MPQTILKVRRVVFGLGMLGALGFGATQAAAGTGPEKKEPRKARYCSSICEPECPGFGGELYGWTCYCCG